MISHGLVSAALFLSVGVIYERMHTRLIINYGGIVMIMPKVFSFINDFCFSVSWITWERVVL